MAYDHSDKIGNEGDLVKHCALVAVLERLPKLKLDGERIHYWDTHAGRPEYILPAKGAWKRGIGKFSESEQVIEDRRRKQDKEDGNGTTDPRFSVAHRYDEVCIGRKLSTGCKYLGSPGIAARLRNLADETLHFRETDKGAFDDLRRYLSSIGGDFQPSDGFAALQSSTQCTLAFIDPPNIKPGTCTALLKTIDQLLKGLKGYSTFYLTWTARTAGRYPKDALPGFRESDDSKNLTTELAKRGTVFSVEWREPTAQGMFGCTLSCSPKLADTVEQAVGEVCQIMGGSWSYTRTGK